MTGSHEQSDKMGGNATNDVEEGELPEEGEIMDEEEEQQQHKEKPTTMKMESGEERDQGIPAQHPPFNNKSRSDSRDSRGGGRGGSSWRRLIGSRGHSEHNFGTEKHSRSGGRYRDHDSRATLKSEEAMMDSWVRGTHRNKGARSPISPQRTADGSPHADQSKQKVQNVDKAVSMVAADQQQDQRVDKPSDTETAAAKTELTAGGDIANSGTKVTGNEEAAQQKQPIPTEDDKDYRVDTPPAAKELHEGSRTFDLIETDDDNDFRRNSFGRFSEKRNFRANTSQLPPRNDAEFSPTSHLRHQRMDTHQTKNATPYEDDEDYGPVPKRHRPTPFFDEENFPIGGDDFRQHQHQFDQSFGHNPYEQHEDFREEHWGGGRGRGGAFHHFRGGRGGMHRPDWGAGPRWSGGGGSGKPFFDRIICKFFREGFCRDGDKCTYSHATADSHRQSVLCRYYQQGFCKRNLFCQNLHGEWPCKAFHKGECTKEQCVFSHEPLDDVSRPILEKMLEDERRGVTDGQNFEPQFQGGYYQRRKMFHQMREQQFHHHHHQPQGDPTQHQQQYSEMAVHNFQSPRQQHFGEVQHNDGTLSEFGERTTRPTAQHQAVQATQQHKPQATAFGDGGAHLMAQAQHSTEPFGASVVSGPSELPPPALVVPSILSGGVPQPQSLSGGCPPSHQPNAVLVAATAYPQHPPPEGDSTSFGFFNRSAAASLGGAPLPHQQATPSAEPGPSLSMPHPNFKQLQQQAQQTPSGPHFPHQPSLLGPSSISTPTLNAMLQHQQHQQQHFATPAKNECLGDVLQQVTPTPPRPSPTREQSDAFNINQMLEEITQQSAEQFSTSKMEDPMDLLSKAVEESPASPPMFGSSSELSATRGADDAKLIPMIREWRLYPVDIPAETEGLPMNFDMKLIQQISSSNSDPRLRKLAEKQFDLVSKTFEKRQQSAVELTDENIKRETTTADSATKANTAEGIAGNTKTRKETGTADPRKDPRRKGRGTTDKQHQNNPSTSSFVASPSAIATPSVSVGVPFIKMESSSPSSGSALAGTSSSRHYVIPPSDSGSAEESLRTQQKLDVTAPFGRMAEGMGQSAAEEHFQQQSFASSPVHVGAPFFGFHHPQQTSAAPFVHPNVPSSMDQQPSAGSAAVPPPFAGPLHAAPFAHHHHQVHASSAGPFNVPPPVLSMSGGPPSGTSNAASSLPQQLGAHAFNVGGFALSSDSIGVTPRAQPSQISSLREKRKNNEYESPLARIAHSSGDAAGSGRRGTARY